MKYYTSPKINYSAFGGMPEGQVPLFNKGQYNLEHPAVIEANKIISEHGISRFPNAQMRNEVSNAWKRSNMSQIPGKGNVVTPESAEMYKLFSNEAGAATAPFLADTAMLYGAEKALSIPEAGAAELPPEVMQERNLYNDLYRKKMLESLAK